MHNRPQTHSGRVRADFDEIARLACSGASGSDRYDGFLLAHVPADARRVLDVGCGLGRLTWALAGAPAGDREVVGVDLSPEMIERAKLPARSPFVSFVCGDFLRTNLGDRVFDCVISVATLHHMPADVAIQRMTALLRPGGRLIIQDLRRDAGVADFLRACVAFAHEMLRRLVKTGRPIDSFKLRGAWARHGLGEHYLSLEEARELAGRLLPGARVFNHWLWRFTILWDRPGAS